MFNLNHHFLCTSWLQVWEGSVKGPDVDGMFVYSLE